VKRLFAVLALLTAWAVPGVASAHPLGNFSNFTVNHYARLEPALTAFTWGTCWIWPRSRRSRRNPATPLILLCMDWNAHARSAGTCQWLLTDGQFRCGLISR
jgi:hypothetical protein